MAASISHTTINCLDACELSGWWKHLLAYTDVPDDLNEPGHEECMIVDPSTAHRLLFIEVDDLQGPPVDDRREPDGSAGWCSRTQRGIASASCAATRSGRRSGDAGATQACMPA